MFITQDQLAGPGSLLFQPDMKVEAKDRQNPNLICVATIANIKDGKLLIHFDGWTSRSSFHVSSVFNDYTMLCVLGMIIGVVPSLLISIRHIGLARTIGNSILLMVECRLLKLMFHYVHLCVCVCMCVF